MVTVAQYHSCCSSCVCVLSKGNNEYQVTHVKKKKRRKEEKKKRSKEVKKKRRKEEKNNNNNNNKQQKDYLRVRGPWSCPCVSLLDDSAKLMMVSGCFCFVSQGRGASNLPAPYVKLHLVVVKVKVKK